MVCAPGSQPGRRSQRPSEIALAMTRARLSERVWENERDAFTNLVDVHVSHLRRKAEGAPMASIAEIVADLDVGSQNFTVEALSLVIKPEWIHEALRRSGRQSCRVRLLPAPLGLWLIVLLSLFRRHSYVNLLGLLAGSLWAQRYWPRCTPPSGPALTQSRDRLGVEPARLLFEQSSESFLASTPGKGSTFSFSLHKAPTA